jgi:transcription antitermination factor NusG
MQLRAIESYLPLYKKVSRWKDRRVVVHLPLFSGYVFVRMALEEKLRVLQIPGLVRLVGFNGTPTPLGDEEMLAMRNGLTTDIHAEPCPYLQIGRRVRIKSGPLAGFQGILLRKKKSYRLVLSVEMIRRSIAVDVDMADIDPLPFAKSKAAHS